MRGFRGISCLPPILVVLQCKTVSDPKSMTPSPHDAIRAAANARDMPYQSLIKIWLQEKVGHQ